MRRLALLAVTLMTGLVLAAAPACADVPEVLAGFQDSPLYVSQRSAVTPDQAVVREALDDLRVPVYVAVLSQADVDAEELGIDGLSLRLLEGIGDPEAVLVVVTDGQELQAVDGGQAGVEASTVLDRVIDARLDEPFGPATLTGALVDLARLIDEGGLVPVREQPRSTRRTVGVAGLVAVAVLGGGGWLYVRTQRRVLAEAPLTREDLVPQEPGWQGVPEQ